MADETLAADNIEACESETTHSALSPVYKECQALAVSNPFTLTGLLCCVYSVFGQCGALQQAYVHIKPGTSADAVRCTVLSWTMDILGQ